MDASVYGHDDRVVLGAASTREQFRAAVDDLRRGLSRLELWGLLGWYDILTRYRRSILGPFWLTISMAVLVGSLGFLYAALFRLPIHDYIPYLASGFLLWGYVSAIFNDGCMAFVQAEGVIKQTSAPFSIHIYRLVWRNLIVFLHNSIVYIAVAFIFSVNVGWELALAVPGILIFILNSLWVATLFGLLNARFRDVGPIVGSILQISFFLTPIIWKPEILEERGQYIFLNPFYHIIEIVRAPLLGTQINELSWLVAIGLAVVGNLISFWAFARYRGRVPFWI